MAAEVEGGIAPEKVADSVFDAIIHERFYILTHPQLNILVKIRMEDILQARNPTPRPPMG